MVHGTPESDHHYLLETVEPAGAREASRSEVQSRASGTSATLILCGHSHIPRVCELDDHRLS
jgi:predicted phosphodiesterase